MAETYRLSQIAPLPNLKNVILDKTIGTGSFGLVKRGKVVNGGYIAVKLVYIKLANKNNITKNDVAREAIIQQRVSHPNIIKMLDFRYDENWAWIAFELAENGELFDKIEPDLGVDQDVAHFYFTQLINAIEFIHKKGIAHRDIKPENLVLDRNGNLKLTDFGLATVFLKKTGLRKRCAEACGSPPYAAPEVTFSSYDPEISDIWSCGIVLFVLLTGKIAWEMPIMEDKDFAYYINNNGEILVSPWNKIDLGALSLLRKILIPNIEERINIEKIKQHQWMLKDRGLLNDKLMCKNPMKLKSRLLINLYINMSDDEFKKVNEYSTQKSNTRNKLETQPIENHIVDDLNDSKSKFFTDLYSTSQQPYSEITKRRKLKNTKEFKHQRELELISMDPALLQFYRQEEGINFEERQLLIEKEINKRTIQLKKHPELYADCFTRFFSFESLDSIVSLLTEALIKLNIIDSDENIECQDVAQKVLNNSIYRGIIKFKVEFIDDYNSRLSGDIVLSKVADNLEVRKIEFIRKSGDPLEWRRLFKRVTILCRDIVYYPH